MAGYRAGKLLIFVIRLTGVRHIHIQLGQKLTECGIHRPPSPHPHRPLNTDASFLCPCKESEIPSLVLK